MDEETSSYQIKERKRKKKVERDYVRKEKNKKELIGNSNTLSQGFLVNKQ